MHVCDNRCGADENVGPERQKLEIRACIAMHVSILAVEQSVVVRFTKQFCIILYI